MHSRARGVLRLWEAVSLPLQPCRRLHIAAPLRAPRKSMRRCFSMLCITLETKLQLIQAPLPRFRSRAVFLLSIAWMAAVCHAATPDGRPSSFDTSSQPQSPSKAARARGNVGRLYRILMPMNGRQSGTENAGAPCTIWIPMIVRGDGWGPDLELCSGRAILCRIAGPEIRPCTNHVRLSLVQSAPHWQCLLPEMWQCSECTKALAKSSTSGQHEE